MRHITIEQTIFHAWQSVQATGEDVLVFAYLNREREVILHQVIAHPKTVIQGSVAKITPGMSMEALEKITERFVAALGLTDYEVAFQNLTHWVCDELKVIRYHAQTLIEKQQNAATKKGRCFITNMKIRAYLTKVSNHPFIESRFPPFKKPVPSNTFATVRPDNDDDDLWEMARVLCKASWTI
jgi:hypothetical protein